jgi:hypothetical protein
MAQSILIFLIILFAAVTLGAPPHRNSLQKRSFHAHARGRGHLTPQQEMLRAHRKYNWEIIIAEDPEIGGGYSVAVPNYSARATQMSVSTAAAVPQVLTHTVFVTASPPTETDAASPIVESAALNSTKTSNTPTATARNEDGEVTTVPEENESEYLSETSVGGQLLNLNFDTGSADL